MQQHHFTTILSILTILIQMATEIQDYNDEETVIEDDEEVIIRSARIVDKSFNKVNYIM